MNRIADVSVIVANFESHANLPLALASLKQQRMPPEYRFEIVVVGGAQQQTSRALNTLGHHHRFTYNMVTLPQLGAHKSQLINKAVRQSGAPYLIFTSADCILPPDHLTKHLAASQSDVVRSGDIIDLDHRTSHRIDLDSITSGAWLKRVPQRVPLKLHRAYLKSLWYETVGQSYQRNLVASNFGIWRHQWERVGGLDERSQDWKQTEQDFEQRLRESDQQLKPIRGQALIYRLHRTPDAPTIPLPAITSSTSSVPVAGAGDR